MNCHKNRNISIVSKHVQQNYYHVTYPTYSPFLWIASPPPGHISNSESKASKWNWTKRFVIPLFLWSRRPVFPIDKLQAKLFFWPIKKKSAIPDYKVIIELMRTYEILFVKFDFVSSVDFIWSCVTSNFFSPKGYKFFYSKASESKVSDVFDAVV